MAHKFDVANHEKLNSEKRRMLLSPEETLTKLGFHSGCTLADIGCGTGLFSIPAARQTSATVYAVDIAPEMLDEVMKNAKDSKIQNIISVKSEEYNFKLESETVDFVLMCTVLHEVDDKRRFLNEAVRICKQGGTIAIIEFRANSTFGPPISHRLMESKVAELLKSLELSEMNTFTISDAFYAVTAKKAVIV